MSEKFSRDEKDQCVVKGHNSLNFFFRMIKLPCLPDDIFWFFKKLSFSKTSLKFYFMLGNKAYSHEFKYN